MSHCRWVRLYDSQLALLSAGENKKIFGSDIAWFPSKSAYLFAMKPDKGVLTLLFAATDPSVKKKSAIYGGAYLVPYGQVQKRSFLSNDMKLANTCGYSGEGSQGEVRDVGGI